MSRLLKALHAQITVDFAERAFDHSLAGKKRTLDDDFGVGRNKQTIAPRLGRYKAQRLLQITADNFVLTDFERSAITRTHLIGRMMPDHRRNRTFLSSFLITAEDPPHMLQ